MEKITFIIHGDPRTKKNSQRIVGTGKRCPLCGKPQKQFIKQSAAHDEWKVNALWQVHSQKSRQENGRTVFPITEPVNIKATFYMRTHRRVDLLNLLAAVDDMLIEAGVIEDDNASIVTAHDGSRVRYDNKGPRVELEIEELL